jgi:ABC-type polysaccharide/polyol phosphate transport system ATPase subunit
MERESKNSDLTEQQLSLSDGEEDDDDVVLEVKDGTFFLGGSESCIQSVEQADNKVNTNSPSSFKLSGINFRLARGEVLAVVGSVASG